MSDETATGATGIEMPNWLSDLFECAISATTLEELLNCLVSTIAREMRASEGSIMLLNEDRDQLSIGAARGLDGRIVRAARRKLGEGISGWVAQNNQPLLLIGPVSEPRFLGVEREIKDAMCVSLLVDGELIGVLSVSNSVAPGTFDEGDLKRISTIADLSARMIANALARTRMKELEIDRERRYLAQEIHDGLIQDITSIALQLELCERFMAKNPERAREQLNKVKNQARVSLQSARELVSGLRLAGLRKKALVEALSEHIARLNEEGQTVSFTFTGTVKPLASTAETNLFRIAQEALTNARMHSQAEHVEVRLDYGKEMVTLVVMDDGVGFPVQPTLEKAQDEGRFGLMGMKERTYLLGGELDIESSPGSGTRLTVKVAL